MNIRSHKYILNYFTYLNDYDIFNNINIIYLTSGSLYRENSATPYHGFHESEVENIHICCV